MEKKYSGTVRKGPTEDTANIAFEFLDKGDVKSALPFLLAAAESGHPGACHSLSVVYFSGSDGNPQDIKTDENGGALGLAGYCENPQQEPNGIHVN